MNYFFTMSRNLCTTIKCTVANSCDSVCYIIKINMTWYFNIVTLNIRPILIY